MRKKDGLATASVDERQAGVARDVADRVNDGLARVTGEPLLFNGADFARTDVTGA